LDHLYNDGCGNATVAHRVDPYTENNCQGYTVTYRWIATDNCDNSTEVTRTFEVLADGERPTFDSNPSDISDINCGQSLPIQEVVTASDNCGTATVTPIILPYTVDNCNGYQVRYRWIAEDACGNTIEMTRAFDVLPDNENPVFDAQPTSILDITCEDDLPVQQTLTATDACGTATVTPSVDNYTENICGGYTITYRWVAEDACGNTTAVTSSFDVVGDSEGPMLTCPDDLTLDCQDLSNSSNSSVPSPISLTGAGSFNMIIKFDGIVEPSPNNCLFGNATFDSGCIGVRTACFGSTLQFTSNFATCGGPLPDLPFTIDFGSGLVVDFDASGTPTVQGDDPIDTWLNTVSATDNCSTVSITNDYDANGFTGGCGSTVGTQVVTFTATDGCNNTSTCSASITINDTDGPTFDAQPASIADINCNDNLPVQQT